jgi:hypothetical protein
MWKSMQIKRAKPGLKAPLVNLGKSGLKVSKLGFGTVDFGVPLNLEPEVGVGF